MCSNLIKTLKLLEERRCLDENLGIMIVPSVNPYSLNTSTRFWATDNTDINRMFPKSKRLYLWNPFYKLLSRRKFHSACQDHENRI